MQIRAGSHHPDGLNPHRFNHEDRDKDNRRVLVPEAVRPGRTLFRWHGDLDLLLGFRMPTMTKAD
ncbi:hypothetical protein SAMN05192558_10466 [Actinokineospora alba]|uniref:Uncharacterized protein n=1 Tax=Actinokineospora alba TaxID=504798 RepID=A0A1H0LAQ9_9PSEU|nr:hypothetical protein C8E96_2785 [Actinokineospora alba]SDJ02845.1 hypothetical protein SAMN05421871_109231 [Actinokineospora alba]SDO65030.1 hypothetical protein SAMN05192558_10466 [Actinokineospora alba]